MTDKPIIFSSPMVRALIEGRKSQTRRLLKKPAAGDALKVFGPAFLMLPGNRDLLPYAPGDRLYVREACAIGWCGENPSHVWYRADGEDKHPEDKWHPSIHMPRWASRLTLTVTEVRVQRLQEISEADAVAEGAKRGPSGDPFFGDLWTHGQMAADTAIVTWAFSACDSYRDLWNSLHGPDAWGSNPWVVAVSFTVEQRNIDA